ncbi:MAG: polysaccharide biosynthesis/export family protein [Pyrinomonadaceae bacterium]
MTANHRLLFKGLKALTTIKASVALIFALSTATYPQGQPTSTPPPAQIAKEPAISSSRISDSRVSSEGRYRIGPGDVLDIRVLNKPQFNREGVRVTPRGTVRMPLLKEEVRAACRTEEELETEITQLLKEYILEPQVTVQIKEYLSEPVAVLGAVRVPSRFQLQRRVRLLEVLTYANGPTDNAGLTIQVVHTEPAAACMASPSEGQPDSSEKLANRIDSYKLADTLRNDENSNPYLRPGDVISIAPADQVYVIGNVIRPTTIALTEALTVSRAIAMAGGTALDTQRTKIHIIRQIPGVADKKDIVIDLEAINRRQAPDVLLVSNDIIEVPAAGGKRFFRTLLGAVLPSVGNLPIRVIP